MTARINLALSIFLVVIAYMTLGLTLLVGDPAEGGATLRTAMLASVVVLSLFVGSQGLRRLLTTMLRGYWNRTSKISYLIIGMCILLLTFGAFYMYTEHRNSLDAILFLLPFSAYTGVAFIHMYFSPVD